MLPQLKNRITSFYHYLTSSIAFFPTVISLAFIVLAIVMISLEDLGASDFIADKVKYIIIDNPDTARTILSTIIGGLISLMVFSFSMVMLLLSQAASNYSPRVLPGLISRKNHQFVLGFFLGTIIYCLLVIINILPDTRAYQTPGLAIFIGLLFGLLSLILFIYFIHSISKSIQIGHILFNIYQDTFYQLELQVKDEKERWTNECPDTSDWFEIKSTQTGYFQDVNLDAMLDVAKEHHTKISIIQPKSSFILKSIPLLRVEKELGKEIQTMLLSCFHFSTEEMINHDFNVGFKQITEIIVKAMSPGINDPGTAINGIDYLSDLYAMRMKLPDNELVKDEKHKGHIYLRTITFQETIYLSLAVIRQYCKHDVVVSLRVYKCFKTYF